VFTTSDTIVAVATPPGRGGIGVIRISGPDAHPVACRLAGRAVRFQPRHATLASIFPARPAPDAAAIDQAIVTFFPGPASYTGDDVVEISAHGNPVVLKAIVAAAMDTGARLAEPGEFTLRAYLNGRIDLMQAEAVADLIDAVTPLQARAAFDQLHGTLTRTIAEIDAALFDLIVRLEASVDFPDEGYHFIKPANVCEAIDALLARTSELLADGRRGRLVREGLHVAIVGLPNAGKSSLFNALIGASRAIVTDVPGTTRDLVTETVDLAGLRVTLVDTAGLRATDDPIECEGVSRSRQAVAVADLTLVVEDRSTARDSNLDDWLQIAANKRLVVAAKCDLAAMWSDDQAVAVSVLTGDGLDLLRRRICEALDVDLLSERPEITNARHLALMQRAHDALKRARAATEEDSPMPEEFALADLLDARAAIEEITGRRTADDVLAHIFERFCVGK
jgi:tRNA modification GTPase